MNLDKNLYDVQYRDGVRVITSKFKHDCDHKLGTYMEDTDYDFLVEEDTDFYGPPVCDLTDLSLTDCGRSCGDCVSDKDILFKYRKNVFTPEEQLGAYEGLVNAAQETQNRGLAAGPKGVSLGSRDWVTEEQLAIMDHFIKMEVSVFNENPIEVIKQKYANNQNEETRGIVWLRNTIRDAGYDYSNFFDEKVQEWLGMTQEEAREDALNVKKNFISETTYANPVYSGIAGFFDRYPRIPYGRATSYTERNWDTFVKCYPFMRNLSNSFKNLLPTRYHNQVECANQIDERFRVAGKDTPFTTITVNKNFRTAAHKDAGDLATGFSNLTVVAKDKEWQGGYLVLPEYRVAINVRPGDLLLINNHEGIHGNTQIIPPDGKSLEDMERISLVCYFREKMMLLGSFEYETARRNFVDHRRLNPDHPMQRKLWNGISVDMWKSEEWYDFLSTQDNGQEMIEKYHPEALEKLGTLEDFL